MTKKEQIDACVNIIIYTMEDYHYDKKLEAVLHVMFATMLIFLSEEDIIDMIKNKVIPKLSEKAHKDYFEFISKVLNKLEDENF